jgi:photosystem II stability/assembly factor-like uncharacterized protein
MLKIFLLSLLTLQFFCGKNYSQWIQLNPGISQNLRSVFAFDLQTAYVTGAGGTLLKTSNSGSNWIALNSGTTQTLHSIYFININTGIACGDNAIIIRTTNGGINWSSVSTTVSSGLYSVSFSNQNNGIICGQGGTILYSTNGGINWIVAVDGFISSLYSCNMVTASTGYSAGVNSIFQPMVAKTTNGGANWNYYVFYLNSNEGNLRGVQFLNEIEGFAVSNVWNGQGGISRTTNTGVNWSTQLFSSALNCIDFPSTLIAYSAGYSGIILKSTDGGLNWVQQASGTSVILRNIDFADSLLGYAAGDNGTILKTTNGGITAVNGNPNEFPKEYLLFQNYPNPFNPTTVIKFLLPNASYAVIKFYDALGNEIQKLQIKGSFKAGLHGITADFSNLPSGVYFYRLDAGNFALTKKMILLK